MINLSQHHLVCAAQAFPYLEMVHPCHFWSQRFVVLLKVACVRLGATVRTMSVLQQAFIIYRSIYFDTVNSETPVAGL